MYDFISNIKVVLPFKSNEHTKSTNSSNIVQGRNEKRYKRAGTMFDFRAIHLFFLFQGWNLFAKKALSCSILYRKTFSTAGITYLVETRSATRQVAIRSIVRLGTC